ncbi:MAG: COQ9 family protein [Alphaproteobacteria bacterium]
MTDRETRKRVILAAAIPGVPFDGWTAKLMRSLDDDAGVLFPGGAADLLGFYLVEADRRMVEALEQVDLPAMKIRQRIAAAIRLRLEQAEPERETVRRTLATLALPGHAGLGLRSLYRTVDAIWRACGDTATDFNFYTKRGLLAGVYSSTLLFWLNDGSPGYENTWAFLDRRIEQVMTIQKARGRFDRLAERLPDPWPILSRLRYPTRA